MFNLVVAFHIHVAYIGSGNVVGKTVASNVIAWTETSFTSSIERLVCIEHKGGFRCIESTQTSTSSTHRNLIHDDGIGFGVHPSHLSDTRCRLNFLVKTVGLYETRIRQSQPHVIVGIANLAVPVLAAVHPNMFFALILIFIYCSEVHEAGTVEMWCHHLEESVVVGRHFALNHSFALLCSRLCELSVYHHLLAQRTTIFTLVSHLLTIGCRVCIGGDIIALTTFGMLSHSLLVLFHQVLQSNICIRVFIPVTFTRLIIQILL